MLTTKLSNSRELNSIYTCTKELPPCSLVKWPGVNLISMDSTKIDKLGIGIDNSVDGVRTIGFMLQINEEGVLTGINENTNSGQEVLRFKLKNVDLVVKRSDRYDNDNNSEKQYDENIERLVLEIKPYLRSSKSIWNALVQARLYIAKYSGSFQMVMADIFELNTNNSFELRIEPKIFALKLEMRYIKQYYQEMPLFNDGDLAVFATKYDPEPFALVYRSLLALYVPKLVISDNGAFNGNQIILKDYNITKEQFFELLYQIYKTGRPLNSNLEELSISAKKLNCELILWPLCREIANYDGLDFIKKVKKSANLHLYDAIKQLCYNVVKTGEWELLQNEGFDARECFGKKIYCNYILPSIVEAFNDKNNMENSFLRACLYEQKHKCPIPSFNSPYEASNPFNACIELDNKKLIYVNIGILRANECLNKFDGFDEIGMKNGSQLKLHPIISSNLKSEMESSQVSLENVLSPLLSLMYGTGDRIPNNLIRSCLIFAFDHGMKKIAKELEEMLSNELIIGPKILLNHFEFAEKYYLKNLERYSLWQLECDEYHKMGLAMLELKEYNKLGKNMRYNIEDRLCSGWGVYNKDLAKREMSGINRFVLFGNSCEPEVASVKNDDLLTVVTDNEAEFDLYQQELFDT